MFTSDGNDCTYLLDYASAYLNPLVDEEGLDLHQRDLNLDRLSLNWVKLNQGKLNERGLDLYMGDFRVYLDLLDLDLDRVHLDLVD